MNLITIGSILYGLLSIIGGIIGYKKSQSKISLISGSISGLLLIIAGLLQINNNIGRVLAAIVTTVLVITFIVRFAKTRKFMPAGLMIIAGIALLVIIALN